MKSRERFLAACTGQSVDRPPVWLMRQAGRYLPEYQAIKASHSFMEMAQTPEIAAEISLQPWRRFQMDGVIVFSDILVPPFAMGQQLCFDEEGPHLSPAIRHMSDIEKLTSFTLSKSAFIADALRLIREEIRDQAALIGFCGSPWTVACYMVEGGSPKRGTFHIKELLSETPEFVEALLEKITEASIPYLQQQIDAGANVLQIFDSWGGQLDEAEYRQFGLPYIRRIIQKLDRQVPIILFCTHGTHLIPLMNESGCDVISIDSTLSLREARLIIPAPIALQGNLKPEILLTTPANVREHTMKMLTQAADSGLGGYIANLGHGVLKETPVECVKAFVECVQNFRY